MFWIRNVLDQECFGSGMFWIRSGLDQECFGSGVVRIRSVLDHECFGSGVFLIRSVWISIRSVSDQVNNNYWLISFNTNYRIWIRISFFKNRTGKYIVYFEKIFHSTSFEFTRFEFEFKDIRPSRISHQSLMFFFASAVSRLRPCSF